MDLQCEMLVVSQWLVEEHLYLGSALLAGGVVILTGVKLRSPQVFPIPVSALECDSYCTELSIENITARPDR